MSCCVWTKNSISRMPPRPELDIVTFHGDFAMAAIGMNLLLHGVNVGDCRVVEVLAPDERRELADEPLAGGNVAGARSRLDQSRALPVSPRLS